MCMIVRLSEKNETQLHLIDYLYYSTCHLVLKFLVLGNAQGRDGLIHTTVRENCIYSALPM